MSNTTNKKKFLRSLLKYWYIFVLIGSICSIFPLHANAQEPGITVSPSLIQLDLATDKPEAVLTYKNFTNQQVLLTLSASDFTQLEDGYKISFLQEKDAKNYQYSLSSWIDFSNKTLILEPNQEATTTVFVAKEKLSPGGHYASILAKIDGKSTKENIQLQGILSSLLFVRTNTGHENDAAQIASFVQNQDFTSFPDTFTLRFNNSGDTQLTPYGVVNVYNQFDTLSAKGILNADSLITLPETIRSFPIPVRKLGFLFPSIYHATLTLHFGKEHIQKTTTITFFSEGDVPLIPLCFGIFVLLFVLRYRKQFSVHEKKQQA